MLHSLTWLNQLVAQRYPLVSHGRVRPRGNPIWRGASLDLRHDYSFVATLCVGNSLNTSNLGGKGADLRSRFFMDDKLSFGIRFPLLLKSDVTNAINDSVVRPC